MEYFEHQRKRYQCTTAGSVMSRLRYQVSASVGSPQVITQGIRKGKKVSSTTLLQYAECIIPRMRQVIQISRIKNTAKTKSHDCLTSLARNGVRIFGDWIGSRFAKLKAEHVALANKARSA